MDATTCPECGAPAEVTDRSALESTDGPIEHVRVVCVRRHWFLMSTARWPAAAGRRYRARPSAGPPGQAGLAARRAAAAATRSSVAVSATRTCRAPAGP